MMSASEEDVFKVEGLPKGVLPVPHPARTLQSKRHPGNRQMSELVSLNKDQYRAGTDEEKDTIAKKIVGLHSEKWQYVKMVDGQWKALTPEETRHKIVRSLGQKPYTATTGKPKAQAQAKANKPAPKNTTTQNVTTEILPTLIAQTNKKRSHDELQAAITVSHTHEGSKNILHVSGENMTKGKRAKTKEQATVLKEKMDLLTKVLESKKVFKHLEALAEESRAKKPRAKKTSGKKSRAKKDKSVELINGAVQIFLDKGKAKAYKSLVEFYPPDKKGLFIKPQELTGLILESMQRANPSLKGHTLTNPAIILGGSKSRGPQPTHFDTLQPLQGPAEWFGIFMLSKNAPATIAYNMEDLPVPLLPSVSDLEKIWPDISPELLTKLHDNKTTRNHIQQCGRLFWASKDRRQEPGIAEQYSTTLMKHIPHCAPPCDKPRAVVFFVLEPADFSGEPYNGETQWSKEQLTLILHDELKESLKQEFKPEERRFFIRKMAEFVRESGQFGAWDDGIDLKNDKLNQVLRGINQAAQELAAAKAKLDARSNHFDLMVAGTDLLEEALATK